MLLAHSEMAENAVFSHFATTFRQVVYVTTFQTKYITSTLAKTNIYYIFAPKEIKNAELNVLLLILALLK